MIPPVFAWMLGAVGAAAVARWVMRETRRINSELDRMRAEPPGETAGRDALPTLKRDPKTGEYRPG